jgi:ubiquinone/menaquinone biosynthesis C-methylase UbiE
MSASEPSAEVRDYYALNRKVYPKFAPFYDLVVRPIAGLRHRVAELAGVGAASRVLDVATGTGEQALAFAEKGADVTGIDISDAMLSVARKKRHPPGLRFLVADATDLPFEEGRFDICCISFALHEMPPSVRVRAVREMARVTQPNGTVVVVDYAIPHVPLLGALSLRLVSLYERDHYVEFVHSDVGALLKDAGIMPSEQHRALLGNAQVVIGRKPGKEPCGPATSPT